jgi:hypothetical protein
MTVDVRTDGPGVAGCERHGPARSAFPPGVGLGTIDHRVPFQCSVSVRVPADPTAQTSAAVTAATETRWLSTGPAFWLFTRRQAVPSQ